MCAGMALTYYDFLTIQDMFSFNNSVNEKNLYEAYCTVFFFKKKQFKYDSLIRLSYSDGWYK